MRERLAPSLFLAFLLSFPLYLGPSGTPQVSTFIAAALILALLMNSRHWIVGSEDIPVLSALAHFVAYVGVVSLSWAIHLGEPEALAAFLYYAFNAALFIALHRIRLRLGWRLQYTALIGILGAILWQVAYHAVTDSVGLRGTVMFNNPNQLGYYGLLCAIILALPGSRVMSKYLRVAGIAGSGLLVAVSLSTAAILGFVALLPVAIVVYRRNILLVAGSVLVALAVTLPSTHEALNGRLSQLGSPQRGHTVEARQYDRVMEHSGYLLFGASEYNERFELQGGREIHSTWVAVLFGYGVIGTILLGRFLWLASGRQYRLLVFLIPVAVYGLGHQGLRFSMLWVLLALLSASRPMDSRGSPLSSNALAFGSVRGR